MATSKNISWKDFVTVRSMLKNPKVSYQNYIIYFCEKATPKKKISWSLFW